MKYIHDIEIFANCFVVVAKIPGKNDWSNFVIWEDIDDRKELIKFLKSNPYLIGYNNLQFDGVLLEAILRNPKITVEELKVIANQCIEDKFPPIPSYQFRNKHLDLYRLWHYNYSSRRTSLKWLEFFFRNKSIKDLPYDHDKEITSKNQINKIITYCRHDVKATETFYFKSLEKIKHRVRVSKELGQNLMNKSDSALGEFLLLNACSKRMNIPITELKKLRTNRTTIKIKDLIFPLYGNWPITNDIIKKYFNKIILYGYLSDDGNRVFDFKSEKDYSIEWGNMEVVYGLGGIHGCVPKGVYKSDQKYIIKSCDVAGEYPNMMINHKIYPEHLGPIFCDVLKEDIVEERKKYPKDVDLQMNLTYKLGGNAAYGKTKFEHSFLYDPKATATVTVNGQLSKTMLGEMLLEIPDSEILMMNTDGLEIKIPRIYEEKYYDICKKWEKITKLDLEHEDYTKLVIESVNHYIGFFSDGKVKRKGRFFIWDDYLKFEDYHKNPSGVIIPESVYNYFKDGTLPETTIKNEQDIYKFFYGIKKQKNFDFVILKSDPGRNVEVQKCSERVLRYYISVGDQAGSLYKFWRDNRITGLNKNSLVVNMNSIRKDDISNFPDINYEYYIEEAYKIIDEIENERLL